MHLLEVLLDGRLRVGKGDSAELEHRFVAERLRQLKRIRQSGNVVSFVNAFLATHPVVVDAGELMEFLPRNHKRG